MAAAGRIVVPNFMPAVDDNGTPLPGAQLFVYVNRTTTLATVYADQALTVPLANPVLADASGQFVPIWQDSDLFFSVAFDSTAGQLGTFDDLQPSTNIGGAANKLDIDAGNADTMTVPNLVTATGGADATATALGLPIPGIIPNTLPSVAALRAFTAANASVNIVYLTGYRLPSDGGEGFFKRDAADMTTPDNGGTVLVDTVGGRWKRVFEGPYRLRWFGAYGNGTDDDSVALQAFFDAVGGSGTPEDAAEGWMEPGDYLFETAPLNLPFNFSTLVGAGTDQTILRYGGASTTTDLVRLHGTISGLAGANNFSGFSVRSDTVMTGGRALSLRYAAKTTLRQFDVGGPFVGEPLNLWNGFCVDSCDFIIADGWFAQAQNDCHQMHGGGAGNPGPQFDFWATNFKCGGGVRGLHVGGGVDNVYYDRGILTQNDNNIAVTNLLSPFKNQEVGFGTQLINDQSQGTAVLIDDPLADTLNYAQITIGCPITAAIGNGVWVKNYPTGFVTIKSPYITKCSADGILSSDNSANIDIANYVSIHENGLHAIASEFNGARIPFLGNAKNNALGTANANVDTTPYAAWQRAFEISGQSDGVEALRAALTLRNRLANSGSGQRWTMIADDLGRMVIADLTDGVEAMTFDADPNVPISTVRKISAAAGFQRLNNEGGVLDLRDSDVAPDFPPGGPYTVGANQRGRTMFWNGTAELVLNLSNAATPGTTIEFIQRNTGKILFQPQAGANMIALGTLSRSAGQGAIVRATCHSNPGGSAALWYLTGDRVA